MQFENLFELTEAMKQNILISGSNASGKTRLACGIASMLHKLGFNVYAFDISGAWKDVSDLPIWFKVKYPQQIKLLEENGIYDLSLLKVSEAKKYVEIISSQIWNSRIEQRNLNPFWLILEESEAYLRNIRGNESSEIYRLVHIGRNISVRNILITTDLALLDASIIRLCSIRFHGKLNIEENAKRKFRAYYGKDYTQIAFEGLDVGDFIRLHKNKLDVVSVPCFVRRKMPIPETYLRQALTIPISQPQKKSFWQWLTKPL